MASRYINSSIEVTLRYYTQSGKKSFHCHFKGGQVLGNGTNFMCKTSLMKLIIETHIKGDMISKRCPTTCIFLH